MPITPDTKNWTWVLERACAECGFDARAVARSDLAWLLRDAGARWPAVVTRAGARDRPDDATWSPLEYACHVRDVYRIGLARLELMLGDDEPAFADWDQDATALADGYALQDPDRVGEEVGAAADALARRYESVAGAQWERPGVRSDGSRFTVESFARYVLHDPIHHLHDVGA